MAEIPHAVLSEHFQQRLRGRRLRSALFLTYQFDPGFFEQEVLPIFFDVALSHAPAIRLLQLEEALFDLQREVAVYYDAHGLVNNNASAKLDVRRIPVRHPTGIFHAKNVLVLVESAEADEEGHRPQSLLVGCLSANLTRSGWWENVEVCHVEEIGEYEKTRLKDDLTAFLRRLQRQVPAEENHAALKQILEFLRETEQRQQRSVAGQPHPHFFSGRESLADFLAAAAGDQLIGANLEIISPYFDDQAECRPLQELCERFQPRKVVVYLPRDAAGVAQCNAELFQSVRELRNVGWGKLPQELVRLGRAENAGERFVHAKVYRFFTVNPKRELFFVGSVNLTSAAHGKGGNLETGFLFAREPQRRPEFWLAPEEHEPESFQARTEEGDAAASRGSRLNVRYDWRRKTAEAYWDEKQVAPALRLEMHGEELCSVPALNSRVWTLLPDAAAAGFERHLKTTSWVTVHGDREEPVVTLVQEESMSYKPSLLLALTPADILRYWSLLSLEQRTAFIEARASELALTDEGAELVTRSRASAELDTLFDRFAGVFHAFQCLEQAVLKALEAEQEKEATCRLFGNKYDSLGNLLQQIGAADYAGDDVDRYLILLCARQLCREIALHYPEFWNTHHDDEQRLEERLAAVEEVRGRLIAGDPVHMAKYLEWFEPRFLRRSRPAAEVQS